MLTLLICLKFFWETKFKSYDEINKNLTGRDYSTGYYFRSPYYIIRTHDENWNYKRPRGTNEKYRSMDSYIPYEDAVRLLDLMREYLNAASLDDYKKGIGKDVLGELADVLDTDK